MLRRIPWNAGKWTRDPVESQERDQHLVVTAAEGSDAWRHTSYGFVHDDQHALLAPFEPGTAVEVTFRAELTAQFDQAGVYVRVDEENWIKAGVEFVDGTTQLGCVVTSVKSDWSAAPVPEWRGENIVVRVSRSADSLTVRAKVERGEFGFVRLVPFDGIFRARAGPYLCAPTAPSLTVTFLSWTETDEDTNLHPS